MSARRVAWPARLSRVLAVIGSSALLGCASDGPVGEREPSWFANAARIALGNGDIERALVNTERGLARHPGSTELLVWRSLLAQMRWNDTRALTYLGRIRQAEGFGGLDQADLFGRIGDLMFQAGAYSDSIPYLQGGAVGPDAMRRTALVELARELPYARLDPPEVAAELPLLDGALPVLLCTIGDKQRPFVLDTGASMTAVTESLAVDLGLGRAIDAGVGTDGIGGEFGIAFGVLDSLSLGAAELTGIPVLLVADESLALRDAFGGPVRRPRGVIGLDILGRFRVTFDPSRRSVLVEKARKLDAPRTVDCVYYEGFCLVPVTVDGRKLWFKLDTGASHSSLTEDGLASLPAARNRVRTSFRRVRAPGGTRVSVREIDGLAIDVSAVQFRSVTLPIVGRRHPSRFPIHGVLGADLVLRCRSTFDHGRLLLEAL